MWHHVWNMFLTHDYYQAGAFQLLAVWDAGNWRSRIELSSMEKAFTYPGLANEFVPRFTICDVPDELVDELKAAPLGQLLFYVDEMLANWESVLAAASDEELCRQLLSPGGRPTTVARRAVSFAMNTAT